MHFAQYRQCKINDLVLSSVGWEITSFLVAISDCLPGFRWVDLGTQPQNSDAHVSLQ